MNYYVRHYGQLVLSVLKEAKRPLRFKELYERLKNHVNRVDLLNTMNYMSRQGMVKFYVHRTVKHYFHPDYDFQPPKVKRRRCQLCGKLLFGYPYRYCKTCLDELERDIGFFSPPWGGSDVTSGRSKEKA